MTENQANYGTKIKFDPLWRGPIEVKRSQTDFPYLISVLIFIGVWIGIAIHAFSNADLKGGSKSITNDDWLRSMSLLIFGFSILATCLCISYVILLRWFPKFITYTAIVVFCIMLIFGIAALGYDYSQTSDSESLIHLIACIIVLVVVILLTLLYRKNINLACEVVRESSKIVMFFPSSFILPVFTCILHIVVTVFGAFVFACLVSIVSRSNEVAGYIYFYHLFNVFGVLWLNSFVVGFGQMILSGTFATWYWTFNKEYISNFTIIHYLKITSRYHLGTIAIGSLVLAICQFLNFLISTLKSNRSISACIYCCFKAFFEILERFINFINRNAYVMCAVHGTTFIRSAKSAFNLFMRNITNVIAVNKVTDMIIFLGQLVVIGVASLSAYGHCRNANLDEMMPSAVGGVVLASLLVTVAFFMVLRTAIDTVFICVLEDYERNDGSTSKPYYMSAKLKELLITASQPYERNYATLE